MFKGYGPLATFSAKIELAYLMGVISAQERRDLLIIKDVRNEFAHRPDERTFGSQRISALCGNLSPRYSKGQFWLSLNQYKMLSWKKPDDVVPRLKRGFYTGPDTPKSRYLAAVQQCLLLLAILRHQAQLIRIACELSPKTRKFWPWSSHRKPEQRVSPAPRTEDRKQKKRKARLRSSRA
jgi:hypothetical protein